MTTSPTSPTSPRPPSSSALFAMFAAFAAATAALVIPATARADEPPPTTTTGSSDGSSNSSNSSFASSAGSFGAAGQWVYSISSPDEFPFRLTKTGDSGWGLTFRPSADTFVIRNVSVGGVVTLSTGGGYSDVGVGARAGYNVPLTSLVSIWIRGGLYFHHTSTDNGPSGNETILDINVPFLFHLVPHFFIGVGPLFHLPLQNSTMMGSGTDPTYGLTATVGGWL